MVAPAKAATSRQRAPLSARASERAAAVGACRAPATSSSPSSLSESHTSAHRGRWPSVCSMRGEAGSGLGPELRRKSSGDKQQAALPLRSSPSPFVRLRLLSSSQRAPFSERGARPSDSPRPRWPSLPRANSRQEVVAAEHNGQPGVEGRLLVVVVARRQAAAEIARPIDFARVDEASLALAQQAEVEVKLWPPKQVEEVEPLQHFHWIKAPEAPIAINPAPHLELRARAEGTG